MHILSLAAYVLLAGACPWKAVARVRWPFRQIPLPDPSDRDRASLETLLAGAPTLRNQQSVLEALAKQLEPLRRKHRLPSYALQPGWRLRRSWGLCRHFRDGRPPLVSVLCTSGPSNREWRSRSSLILTLLHEMAHLRHRSHGRRFWALHRALIDDAAGVGLYTPEEPSVPEGAQGDTKLLGSAAEHLAHQAQTRRAERHAVNRAAAQAWAPGMAARVSTKTGRLAGARVQVLAVARTRVVVAAPDGLRYRVPASLLASESS